MERPRARWVVGTGLVWALLGTLVGAAFFALPTPPTQAQVSITMVMADALTFEPNTLQTDPGDNVTIRVVNGGVLRHTFTLFESVNASVPVDDNDALQDFYAINPTLLDVDLQGGQEATVNFTVPTTEGVYTFVCIVANHAVGGMHGLMFVGMPPSPPDIFGGIGIVQGLFLLTLVGVAVFAVIYQIRSTRP